MAEVKRTENSFDVYQDGAKAGTMQFHMNNGDVMEITHTEVDEKYSGQGLGKQLVRAGVDYAKKENYKIEPTCSYARSIISKTPEFQDILK